MKSYIVLLTSGKISSLQLYRITPMVCKKAQVYEIKWVKTLTTIRRVMLNSHTVTSDCVSPVSIPLQSVSHLFLYHSKLVLKHSKCCLSSTGFQPPKRLYCVSLGSLLLLSLTEIIFAVYFCSRYFNVLKNLSTTLCVAFAMNNKINWNSGKGV